MRSYGRHAGMNWDGALKGLTSYFLYHTVCPAASSPVFQHLKAEEHHFGLGVVSLFAVLWTSTVPLERWERFLNLAHVLLAASLVHPSC